MKGNNIISVCQAQMNDIVQQWLDKFVLKTEESPTVTGVKWNQSSNSFDIHTTEKEKETQK